MKNQKYAFYLIFLGFFLFSTLASAQTGGTYDLTHSVIASGGGSNSAGGTFRVDGTTGQNLAGTLSTGGTYSLRGGFWAFEAAAPTAAMVGVSGRVLTADGRGIRNARVFLTDQSGIVRMTQTSAFGHFRFLEVAVGQQYTVEVTSKQFKFANPTQIIAVNDEVTGLDFIALPRW